MPLLAFPCAKKLSLKKLLFSSITHTHNLKYTPFFFWVIWSRLEGGYSLVRVPEGCKGLLEAHILGAGVLAHGLFKNDVFTR